MSIATGSRTDPAPLVSVITVNLNGEKYLRGLLESLERQNYPNFEILVVDNGSTDGSEAIVRSEFPAVRWIDAGKNIGFAAANNLGIRRSEGRYVALINNDTVVAEDWLHHLVREAQSDPNIGAVGSKILFATPFVPVRLEIPTFCPAVSGISADTRKLGMFVDRSSGFEPRRYAKTIFKDGFHGEERVENRTGQWSGGDATVFFPVEAGFESTDLVLRLYGRKQGMAQPCRLHVGDTTLQTLDIGSGWSRHRIPVSSEILQRSAFEVINNAGSLLTRSGDVGDRGIYEPDTGQYDAAEDVNALCGCSMLLPREVLGHVGGLEAELFMYFEDTEISWRIRKAGYRLRYQPKSVVRHFHASTSGEWSPFFTFLVSRNRLLFLLRHAPFRAAIRAYVRDLASLGKLLWTRRSLRDPELRTRLRVHASFLKKAPHFILGRLRQE